MGNDVIKGRARMSKATWQLGTYKTPSIALPCLIFISKKL